MSLIVFYSLAAVVVLGALGVVLLRNVFYSSLCLGVTLVAVGGLFPLLGADFLFAVQILLYAGGVAVLLLFVILLSGRSEDLLKRQVNEQWFASLLVVAAVAVILGVSFKKMAWHETQAAFETATTGPLGTLLLSDMAVPFEVISLVLLAALVGAMVFSKKDPS